MFSTLVCKDYTIRICNILQCRYSYIGHYHCVPHLSKDLYLTGIWMKLVESCRTLPLKNLSLTAIARHIILLISTHILSFIQIPVCVLYGCCFLFIIINLLHKSSLYLCVWKLIRHSNMFPCHVSQVKYSYFNFKVVIFNKKMSKPIKNS